MIDQEERSENGEKRSHLEMFGMETMILTPLATVKQDIVWCLLVVAPQ